MSGRTELGYEKDQLNWRHEINQQNGRLRGPCCYILDSFPLFSFPFSLLKAKAALLPSNAHYANF